MTYPGVTTAAAGGLSLYGDGSDGNVTISVDTTLTRDMYYDTLTVNSGITLNTSGWRVFAKTAIVNNGTIKCGGVAGAGIVGGTPATSGALSTGWDGYGGGNGAVGNSTANRTIPSVVGIGGAGGASGTGLAGGTVATTALATTYGTPRSLPNAITGYAIVGSLTPAFFTGGQGGAGGAGASGSPGGGGGQGGGVMVLAAKTITNAGTITVAGGNGAAGTGTNAGGGGGGGGGWVSIIYTTLNNAGTITAAGGTGGGKVGTGVAGSNGTAGTVIYLPN